MKLIAAEQKVHTHTLKIFLLVIIENAQSIIENNEEAWNFFPSRNWILIVLEPVKGIRLEISRNTANDV